MDDDGLNDGSTGSNAMVDGSDGSGQCSWQLEELEAMETALLGEAEEVSSCRTLFPNATGVQQEHHLPSGGKLSFQQIWWHKLFPSGGEDERLTFENGRFQHMFISTLQLGTRQRYPCGTGLRRCCSAGGNAFVLSEHKWNPNKIRL